MFGIRLRQEKQRLSDLAASRGERLTEATRYIEVLTAQRRRHLRRHADLVNVIAAHITTGTTPEELRKATVRAGFRAELEYALLEQAPAKTHERTTATPQEDQ